MQVRSALADVGADCFLATTLDEVAWLLNLRGSDVSYNPGEPAGVLCVSAFSSMHCNNARCTPWPVVCARLAALALPVARCTTPPCCSNSTRSDAHSAIVASHQPHRAHPLLRRPAVFVSYALVARDGAVLYTNPAKVTPTVAEHLAAGGVVVKPYDALLGDVRARASAKARIAMDLSKVCESLARARLIVGWLAGWLSWLAGWHWDMAAAATAPCNSNASNAAACVALPTFTVCNGCTCPPALPGQLCRIPGRRGGGHQRAARQEAQRSRRGRRG